jgi:hypothetical protein
MWQAKILSLTFVAVQSEFTLRASNIFTATEAPEEAQIILHGSG